MTHDHMDDMLTRREVVEAIATLGKEYSDTGDPVFDRIAAAFSRLAGELSEPRS